jgi:hypothetical protein
MGPPHETSPNASQVQVLPSDSRNGSPTLCSSSPETGHDFGDGDEQACVAMTKRANPPTALGRPDARGMAASLPGPAHPKPPLKLEQPTGTPWPGTSIVERRPVGNADLAVGRALAMASAHDGVRDNLE